jgi:hypothetical protein
LRKRRAVVCSKGGGVEVNGLMKRMEAAHFEAGVEAAACSGASDELMVCSGAGIEDGRWWCKRNGF